MTARTVRRHKNRARRILDSNMRMAEMNRVLVDAIHHLNHLSTEAWSLGLDDELTAVLRECRRRLEWNLLAIEARYTPDHVMLAKLEALDAA